jgi:hypothetical protein
MLLTIIADRLEVLLAGGNQFDPLANDSALSWY